METITTRKGDKASDSPMLTVAELSAEEMKLAYDCTHVELVTHLKELLDLPIPFGEKPSFNFDLDETLLSHPFDSIPFTVSDFKWTTLNSQTKNDIRDCLLALRKKYPNGTICLLTNSRKDGSHEGIDKKLTDTGIDPEWFDRIDYRTDENKSLLKGQRIFNAIDKLDEDKHPTHVIMVDDMALNLIAVARACKDRCMPCTTLHFVAGILKQHLKFAHQQKFTSMGTFNSKYKQQEVLENKYIRKLIGTSEQVKLESAATTPTGASKLLPTKPTLDRASKLIESPKAVEQKPEAHTQKPTAEKKTPPPKKRKGSVQKTKSKTKL
ncbi:DUF2608 domain-containing protein [Parashewanella curva]|nr:DUF2608 domain-containing protein [Parashewanella curva]